MNLFNADQRFTMSYAAYDQAEDLDVRFSVYDISTGTAVFIEDVQATFLALGTYEASYIPEAGKIYLVIGAAYTSGTPTPYRSPTCETYREVGSTMLATAYGTYDYNAGLFIQTSIYDASGVTPTFIQNTPMVLVALGVYLAMYIATADKAYNFISAVYTDGTYATVDTNWSPVSEDMDCVGDVTVVIELENAILEGQRVDAVLEGYCA